jgi:hypothetical protein
MHTSDSDLVMLDPSFILSAEGTAWIEEEGAHASRGVIVPATFMAWLSSGAPVEELLILVAPEDVEGLEERRALLAQLLRVTPTFSFEQGDLEIQDQEVMLTLLETGGPIAATFADEWAFLQSHSWMVSKLHLPLDAFRDAGAAVLEYGRRLRDEMVSVVIRQSAAPPALTGTLLARAAAKWVVVGGAGAGGALLGPVGAGILGSGVAVPVVRAFDP